MTDDWKHVETCTYYMQAENVTNTLIKIEGFPLVCSGMINMVEEWSMCDYNETKLGCLDVVGHVFKIVERAVTGSRETSLLLVLSEAVAQLLGALEMRFVFGKGDSLELLRRQLVYWSAVLVAA